ncbi:hypothetical protein ASA_1037 [Aeromonas salmonicida subsp. salmonicida A449]|uniref:Uncharacterized protein n=1 Tax=Aeromonas salmonicida (strain A449) TaxID=382245 RepID=A4SJU2_AERS4|nr:hypothetical protein ASA_1037 [Aeromonas salmonicida subsp. salmonicida A449]
MTTATLGWPCCYRPGLPIRGEEPLSEKGGRARYLFMDFKCRLFGYNGCLVSINVNYWMFKFNKWRECDKFGSFYLLSFFRDLTACHPLADHRQD